MNKVLAIGRLTRDVNTKTSEKAGKVGKFTLAVDRRYKTEGQPTTDFLPVTVFGKQAEFAEKYLGKGKKIAVEGRLQSGSYTKDDGTKVYTLDVIAENIEFVESKASEAANKSATKDSDFLNIPDGEEELPFA